MEDLSFLDKIDLSEPAVKQAWDEAEAWFRNLPVHLRPSTKTMEDRVRLRYLIALRAFRQMIRLAKLADLPWLIETARIAYEHGTFNDAAAEKWLRSLMDSPSVLFLRGDRAAAVAIIKELPYAPGIRSGYLLPVFSRGNAGAELMRMTDMILKWAHTHGAGAFYFAAVTGVDFGPLARRFGGVPVSPSYVVRL